jgi:Na+-translocating ferredoxin:NAD+ oxidoreductase RnfG subunit
LSFRLSTTAASVLVALLCGAAAAPAVVYHSQREALELAFPEADRIERRSFVLTDEQANVIQELARAPLGSRIVTFHVGWRGDQVIGYAAIDVHTVRTLPEALLVILTPQGMVRSVRVLAFHEPEEYLPMRRWFDQFTGRKLEPSLQLKRGIHAVSGATLSARATTRSVRRTLALYQVLIREHK